MDWENEELIIELWETYNNKIGLLELKESLGSPDEKDSYQKIDTTLLCTLIDMFSEIKKSFGSAFVPEINSGYRTKKHNKKEKGVSGSSHTKGLAVDLAVTDSEFRYYFIEMCYRYGFKRIGVYKTFIHIDIDYSRNYPRCWVG